MPWFITSICSDEALENLRHEIINPEYPRPQRTFGFFNEYNDAFVAIRDNRGNMQEFLYDYLVLEYIEPGVHPTVHATEWYRWCETEKRWERIYNENVLQEFQNDTNFALG